jgi:hypothetical protein
MALKAKVGGRESDSYVTVSESDTIAARLPDDTTEWPMLSDEAKELRLQLAAQMIGCLPLRGRKIYEGQALSFPRSGGLHSPKEIPQDIKDAQVMIAYSVVHRALQNRPGVSEEATEKVSSVSLGGLLSVGFAIGKSGTALSYLDAVVQSLSFPIHMKMKRYTAQLRGWQTGSSECGTLSTTTTTTASSTSTTTTT